MPLTVTIKHEDVYQAGGAVPVTVVVANTSNDPLLVNSRLLNNFEVSEGELFLTIKNPAGREFGFQAFVTPRQLDEKDFVVLDPGAALTANVDLNEDYAITDAGTYEVVAAYRNQKPWIKGELKAWVGKVDCEPVKIELN